MLIAKCNDNYKGIGAWVGNYTESRDVAERRKNGQESGVVGIYAIQFSRSRAAHLDMYKDHLRKLTEVLSQSALSTIITSCGNYQAINFHKMNCPSYHAHNTTIYNKSV